MIAQIIVIDLVFSLDSIITAVGMVSEVGVMIAAVVASVGLMMLFAKSIGEFVRIHWSMSKEDAEDLLTIVSLIHRRLDKAHMPPRV